MNLVKSFTILAFVACTGSSFAQGLLSLRPQKDEFERRIPLTYSVSAGAGYDSNANLASDNEEDSAYAQFGLGARYASGDRQTSYSIDASYGGQYYLDAPEGQDDYQNSFRLGANIRHRVSPRLTITDSAYAAYEYEPNYSVGAGTTRRSEPYIYFMNNLSVGYAWSRKLSTVTSYTISGIDYSDDVSESFLSHTLSQELRYQMSKLTVGVLEYRFALSTYDTDFGDYTSHYLLAGVDHSLTRRYYTSLRAGAELRDRDNGGEEISPYVEGILNYRAGEHTTLSSYVRWGYDDSSIGSYTERSSVRIGANARHQLNSRLAASAGLHYIHDMYEGSDVADSYDEDVVSLSLGVEYGLYKNISLYSGYTFTTASSGNGLRDYDRHNVNVGVRAQF
jgi:hypothetical protein